MHFGQSGLLKATECNSATYFYSPPRLFHPPPQTQQKRATSVLYVRLSLLLETFSEQKCMAVCARRNPLSRRLTRAVYALVRTCAKFSTSSDWGTPRSAIPATGTRPTLETLDCAAAGSQRVRRYGFSERLVPETRCYCSARLGNRAALDFGLEPALSQLGIQTLKKNDNPHTWWGSNQYTSATENNPREAWRRVPPRSRG